MHHSIELFHLPTLMHNCALKLVNEIILYYDARSKKHQITRLNVKIYFDVFLSVLISLWVLFSFYLPIFEFAMLLVQLYFCQ